MKRVLVSAVVLPVATGLARAGDVVDGARLLDKASPWSFSLVVVIPIAPF